MMLIDSHCHIQFNAYKEDADEVIRRSFDAGVKMIVVGSQKTTSERAVDLAQKYDGVWAVVGLHPIHVTAQEVDEEEIHFKSREEKFDYDYYKKLASQPKVAGIGETGFDFYHLPKTLTLEEVEKRQEESFLAQVSLADELNLPLAIHCRGAHEVLLAVLKKCVREGKMKKRGVAHCFSGDWEIAKQYLELGFYLGFTGVITFQPRASQKQKFETTWEVIKKTPLDRILIETDAPYLSPEPYRGKRNEPGYVKFVAEKIAELKNLAFEEVAAQTAKNTVKLFSLDL